MKPYTLLFSVKNLLELHIGRLQELFDGNSVKTAICFADVKSEAT
jgi:hypothetical protein